MQIIIKNFGPIKECRYELDKDLLCIYGENNIGKSYSMQLVYLLLKSIINNEEFFYFYSERRRGDRDYLKTLETTVETFKSNIRNEKEDISEQVREIIGREIYSAIGVNFYESCKNTFDSLSNAVQENTEVSISIKSTKICFYVKDETVKVVGVPTKPILLARATHNHYHKYKHTEYNSFIYVGEEDDKERIAYNIIEDIYEQYRELLRQFRAVFSDVYFLPASRSGIYRGMSAFGAIIAQLSKNRQYFSRKIELPGLSEPIADYYISLSTGVDVSLYNKLLEKNEAGSYVAICKEIEKEILKGEITYDKKENALYYKEEGKEFKLRMNEVSSMVSEIAPIVAFLKYIIMASSSRYRRGIRPIIFIEEPEAHLHPQNQIKLIESFVKLVNNGVKIILSSHSNYIFNKLNNLILDKKLDYKKYLPILMQKEEKGSKTIYMDNDELGTADTNFADVSYSLMEERESILNELNGDAE